MKVLCLLVCFFATTTAADLPPPITVRIDDRCTKFLQAAHAPGLSVAVGVADKVAYEKGYGLADVENHVPASAKTRYRTASIAKSMTAVIALHLADDGKLDLEAPVQQYLPEYPKKPWPINARQLLSHLSGIRHYAQPGESAGKERFNSIRDALAIFANDPLLHEPDTQFYYTSYGYNLLGAVAESAGSASFAELLRRIVTEPAGMASTCLDDQRQIIPDRARGYTLTGDAGLQNCELHDTSMKVPGGGLLSTPADLVRFMQAANSGKLLKPETVKRMWTGQHTKAGTQTDYGLGWKISPDGAKLRAVSHSGGQAGVTTLMMLQPDTGRAVAVMCNLEKAKITPLVEEILQELGKEP